MFYILIGLIVILTGTVVFLSMNDTINFNDIVAKLFKVKEKAASRSVPAEMYDLLEIERDRIAKDIHDVVLSKLIATTLEMEILLVNGRLNPTIEKSVTSMKKDVQGSISSLREIIYDISNKSFESDDFNASILDLCRTFDSTKRLIVRFKTNEQSFMLSSIQKQHIFRIIQELLTNTMKHSNAWNVVVMFIWSYDNLELRYEDDGKGITTVKTTNSYGLNSIQQRCKVCNAKYEFLKPPVGMEFRMYVRKVL